MSRGLCLKKSALTLCSAAFALAVGCGSDDDGSRAADGGGRDANILDSAYVDASSSWDGGGPLMDAAGAKDAATCTDMPCDPLEGSCDEPLLTCVLTGLEPSCEEKQSLLQGDVGEPCETPLDCLPQLACFRRGDSGVCARVCCGEGDGICEEVGLRCGGTGVLVNGDATSWRQCVGLRPCNVLNPDKACEPGEGCYITSTGGDTDCLAAGRSQLGDACQAANDCAAGLFCGGLTTPGTCQRICDLGEEVTVSCGPEEGTCVAYAHSPEGSGLCTPEG